MSSGISTTKKSAMAYNAKAAKSVGWGDMIPCGLIGQYPNLGQAPDSELFALAVESFQEDNRLDADGKLGRGTWSLMLKLYDKVEDGEPFWTVNDRRLNVWLDDEVESVNFDQKGGLDLHRFGHFSSRKGIKPHLIVVHWGGLDPHHCYRIFSSPDRQVSSHAGCGLSPDGKPTIYQYLDLHHKSWHAGWVNSYSVGIDICQQPELKWKDKYLKKGYDVEDMVNDTGRGAKKVLTLDPRVAAASREAVKSLCAVLDIPFEFPRGKDGQAKSGSFYHGVVDKDYLINGFSGVIGHHHIKSGKWDCACWWETLFGE